ncbi:sugar transferase [Pseudonocardia humida]|uniref:Sugar transferase n=1 Tax=Pseudonocardia humida TaxID=2800819 RepID=A0ABT1A5H2_9PSEU|nr:sugar transferase [Pseudonocardia humida]MCO1658257.1 sugar transferase [Pseudonocardia humida]
MPATPARRRLRHALAAASTDTTAVCAAVLSYALLGGAPHGRVLGVGVVVVLLTAACLALSRAWDVDAAGAGSGGFARLLRGFLTAAATIAMVVLAAGLDGARPWVFAVLPTAAGLAVLGRLWLRSELHRRRRTGRAMARVLAVGDVEGVAGLVRRTRRAPEHGWAVHGVCTPAGMGPRCTSFVEEVRVVGDLDSVPALARSGQFDVVWIGRAPGWTTTRLRGMARELEGTGVELAVDPELVEVIGPRLHVARVDGPPLLRLSHPASDGPARLLKGGLDRVGALVALALLSPVLLVIAVLVKLDGGPVFVRQRRVGVGGRGFRMVRFRSTAVDAGARVTRVGAVLRRCSLDELPQLFNVLAGTMSLVGPRPPLPREVAGYADDARRRLLVKPGMTGLWQVSGRSDLSWEESVRLDLRYVENWTMALDARILARTVHAMVRGGGAD